MESVRWLEGHVAWTFRRPSRAARRAFAEQHALGIGVLTLRGTGGGLPIEAEKSFAGVILEQGLARFDATKRVLPLASVTVAAAVCLRPEPNPDDIGAVWELTITGPDGVHWTVRGPWLYLAHLGTLAGWPQPDERAPTWVPVPAAGGYRGNDVAPLAWTYVPQTRWCQRVLEFVSLVGGALVGLVYGWWKAFDADLSGNLATLVMGLIGGGAGLLVFIGVRKGRLWAPFSRFGSVRMRGTGGGIPTASGGAWFRVEVGARKATFHTGLRTVELPLTQAKVVAARRVGWPRRDPRSADSLWELDLEGPGIAWTIRGRWIRLAVLGGLGDWPEPSEVFPGAHPAIPPAPDTSPPPTEPPSSSTFERYPTA